jgi:two-component system response regulator
MDELRRFEVVLVEDSDTDAELTLRALKQHKLVNNVVLLRDGAEALDFIFRRGAYSSYENTNPYLVLLDLDLPKVDGIGVLRALKGEERTEAIPVVVLTSSNRERELVESYRLGVSHYLRKPVEFRDFSNVIAQCLPLET